MSNISLKAENICKKYLISNTREQYSSYREVISNKFKRIINNNFEESYQTFDALSDINFEIYEGDSLGIIGKNGAGKSTLLKVLSQITKPSSGRIIINGRISSLLEVGTGFHPELTGRENIFLNGSILGMSRKEINRKFDEIVDFSGVEQFLDTPVKRYSSGMYVRLAFAVAAHLETEILVVDEVLAVGDTEFQRKCLGKMKEVSSQSGRTVLFVSHNMGAIQNLCNKAILLNKGNIISHGNPKDLTEEYLLLNSNKEDKEIDRTGDQKVYFDDFFISNEKGATTDSFFMGDSIFLVLNIKFNCNINNAEIGINIKNSFGELVSHISSKDVERSISGNVNQEVNIQIKMKNIFYSPGEYFVDLALVSFSDHHDFILDALSFTLSEGQLIKRGFFPKHVKVFTQTEWK